MVILAGVALFAALLPGAEGPSRAAERFALAVAAVERAEPAGGSRYALRGTWTSAEEPNARFELKASLEVEGATCGAQAEVLFANGFE